MNLPMMATAILKELSVKEIKQAAHNFGVSHYYFVQKIKSIETSNIELNQAVQCMIAVFRARSKNIERLYQEFLKELEKSNSDE